MSSFWRSYRTFPRALCPKTGHPSKNLRNFSSRPQGRHTRRTLHPGEGSEPPPEIRVMAGKTSISPTRKPVNSHQSWPADAPSSLPILLPSSFPPTLSSYGHTQRPETYPDRHPRLHREHEPREPVVSCKYVTGEGVTCMGRFSRWKSSLRLPRSPTQPKGACRPMSTIRRKSLAAKMLRRSNPIGLLPVHTWTTVRHE